MIWKFFVFYYWRNFDWSWANSRKIIKLLQFKGGKLHLKNFLFLNTHVFRVKPRFANIKRLQTSQLIETVHWPLAQVNYFASNSLGVDIDKRARPYWSEFRLSSSQQLYTYDNSVFLVPFRCIRVFRSFIDAILAVVWVCVSNRSNFSLKSCGNFRHF